MSGPSYKDIKLFPRNLTARAEVVVRGNPVTSRLEDGVENCFPGLEYDERNFDKYFLPGLVFEWHHDAGVILREVSSDGPFGERFSADQIAAGLFLVAVRAVFASRLQGEKPSPGVRFFLPPAGLDAWRIARDIEPGEVDVVIAPRAALARLESNPGLRTRLRNWLRVERGISGEPFSIFEDSLGKPNTHLVGQRARFLTDAGVVDDNLVPPGALTQSLCSPWQYDFADCGCFYWAANKPDLVASLHQPDRVLNFQRRDRSETADRATRAEDWVTRLEKRWDDRRHILNHAETIMHWTDMTFVVDGRETSEYAPVRRTSTRPRLTRAQIIDRLKRLAPVEHALCAEYLYAFYSLRITAPLSGPPPAEAVAARIFAAGQEVFAVAIDEMRHLRAVNEILILLGEQPVLRRAVIIGEDFDGTGNAFQQPFELAPLTPSQLNWFIDVERSSPQHDSGAGSIDGMYTQILVSLEDSAEFSDAEKERFAHLIKIIIDEGVDHFRRFTEAQRMLGGLAEDTYLRYGQPVRLPDNDRFRVLQDTLDAAYVVVLQSLEFVFQFGNEQRGAMVEAARRAMFNIDDAARSLSSRGLTPMFDLSLWAPAEPQALGPVPMGVGPADLRAVTRPLEDPIARLAASPDPELQALATRLQDRSTDLVRAFEAILSP